MATSAVQLQRTRCACTQYPHTNGKVWSKGLGGEGQVISIPPLIASARCMMYGTCPKQSKRVRVSVRVRVRAEWVCAGWMHPQAVHVYSHTHIAYILSCGVACGLLMVGSNKRQILTVCTRGHGCWAQAEGEEGEEQVRRRPRPVQRVGVLWRGAF